MTGSSRSWDEAAVRGGRISGIVGVSAGMLCVVWGLVFGPSMALRAWLAAWLFFLGISLGGLAMLMIYHLTGGAWGFLVRRILESQALAITWLAALFVPVALGVSQLYPWAHSEGLGPLTRKSTQSYLNPESYWMRAVIYFLIWSSLAYRLRSWSLKQAEGERQEWLWRFQRISEVGLVLFGTTMHFAAFDWVQMLTPGFRSTLFPMLIVAGQFISAIAFAVVALRWVSDQELFRPFHSERACIDLGNLMLAFLVVWAYLLWFQFMLVWMANLPYGAEWHVPRMRGVWGGITLAVIVLHFFLPFTALLFRATKRRLRVLSRVAALILAAHLVFEFELILPTFSGEGMVPGLSVFWAPLAVGGFWCRAFLRALRAQPLIAENDPNRTRAESLMALEHAEWRREETLAHE